VSAAAQQSVEADEVRDGSRMARPSQLNAVLSGPMGRPGGGGSVLLSAAMTAALLLRGADAGSPEQGLVAGADAEAAQVVWSYDTGG
jgi:hypothetical protein